MSWLRSLNSEFLVRITKIQFDEQMISTITPYPASLGSDEHCSAGHRAWILR